MGQLYHIPVDVATSMVLKPFSDRTGPLKVEFAIISSYGNKFYCLGLSARSVDRTNIIILVLLIV